MNKKWLPFLVVLLLGLLLWYVKRKQANENPPTTTTERKGRDQSTEVNRNRGFDRRASYIEYTAHAKCRMGCRKISQAEVQEIMKEGKINYSKSDTKDRPCPTYALEGTTSDDQRVRIVYAQCDTKTKVVTVIDLGTDWKCHCPGDVKN